MLGDGTAVAIALLLASTEQSEPFSWSTIAEQLQQVMPTWLWVVLSLSVVAFLVLIDIGDKLSGIFGSPFQRSQPSTDQLKDIRRQLLTIVKKEVDRRLATSLHNLVKLDLYMEDQRQRVGNPKLELVPEDNERSFQAVNRVLHPKGDRPPLDLKFTQKVIEVFDRPDIQGKLLILGDPGSGKTTELLQLAQDLVTRVEDDERQPVPVILELSSWNEEPLDKWVAKQLDKLYNLSEATTQQWLENNQILLLLDGLDELGLTKQKQCIDQINQFLETTRTSEIIVCCRREEYEAGKIELHKLNGAVYLEDLKEAQIRQYFAELNRSSLWENVRGNPALLELAQKPLFLFMLVVAYQGNPIRNEQELFDAYIEKQLHESGNQGTYKSGKEPSPKQTRHYLVWLAKQLENVRETEFLIEFLQPSLLSSKKQRRLYKLSYGLFCGLVNGLVTGQLGGLVGGLYGGLLSEIVRELGGQRVGSQEGVRRIFFVFYCVFFFFLLGRSCVLSFGLVCGLVIGLAIGLLGGLFGGLVGGLFRLPITETAMTNQGI